MPATPDSDTLDQDLEDDVLEDRPLPHSFSECVRESPLTALTAAFVAGLVLGRLVL